LSFDLGAGTVWVSSDSRAFASQLQAVYRSFPFSPNGDWADLHVRIDRGAGLRRWFRRQASFFCDGSRPFEPFPADSPLPMFEWGTNWLIAQRFSHLLLLHSGVAERDGRALIMPAMPGSGKSTLTAALALSGWRLLSDEFGAFDPAEGVFRAVLKPIGLKNASIKLIRGRFPSAHFGPEFPKTRKGTVAHLAATPEAVARRHETARPGAIVVPRWQAGSATHLTRLDPQTVFGTLAFNAFNFKLLGAVGFDAVVYLTRTCPAYQLTYSGLDEGIAAVDELWSALSEGRAA
jgi:HprK-related kinase A